MAKYKGKYLSASLKMWDLIELTKLLKLKYLLTKKS